MLLKTVGSTLPKIVGFMFADYKTPNRNSVGSTMPKTVGSKLLITFMLFFKINCYRGFAYIITFVFIDYY